LLEAVAAAATGVATIKNALRIRQMIESRSSSRVRFLLAVDDLLNSQLEYYRARGPEYDEWFLRKRRYDHGPELNRRWFSEITEVRHWLSSQGPLGDVLELAAGTGLWTESLVTQSRSLHCIDAAPEALTLNRARMTRHEADITYELADIFQWRPSRRYDTIFFGFWLSHVPGDRFVPFWRLVEEACAEGGHTLLVDSLADPASTARDHAIESSGQVTRRLNDGREFRIVKKFWDPKRLAQRLATIGWEARLDTTPTYFLFGTAGRSARTMPTDQN
jgi:2-polyprenyl-3-methyl-5-hydroxy-6-metoxy-1,4-benzoquinol methylase